MPSAERTVRTEGVVLRHSDWGEADRLLVIYSRELGKMRAVAKGARKLHSRKAGHLEPFTRVKLLLARGRDFWIVTQAESIDAYLSIREDLVRTGYAAYVMELADRFNYEEGENRSMYHLVTDTLERIASMPDPFIAVRYYDIRLLDLLGFRPELNNCLRCQEVIQPQDQFFDAAMGGVLCPRCGESVATARTISLNTLKYLRHFQRSTFQEASRAPLTPEVKQEMETLMHYYLTFLLERRLNTPGFIHEVRRDGNKNA
jgi:DNA repair protein RecO (recombination protein O)